MTVKFLFNCLSLIVLFGTASIANGGIVYNEATDGDLGWPETPTNLGSAGLGINTVTGLLDNEKESGFDPDAFMFIVDAGFQLDSLMFTSMSGDGDHFFAFNNGPLVTFDGAGNLISTLVSASDVGTNILDGTLNSYGGSGLSGGPLGAGTYYVWFQEGSPDSHEYVLSFSVSSVPEPSSMLLLGAGLGCAAFRRRRWWGAACRAGL